MYPYISVLGLSTPRHLISHVREAQEWPSRCPKEAQEWSPCCRPTAPWLDIVPSQLNEDSDLPIHSLLPQYMAQS